MHSQQVLQQQPPEKPFTLLVARLVDPGWLAASRRIRKGGGVPTQGLFLDCKNISQGPTLVPKTGTAFLNFWCFFRFLGPLFVPRNCTKNWSRIRPSLRKLIAMAPRGQFLGPVFEPRFGPIFGPTVRFFPGNLELFWGTSWGSLSCRPQDLLQGVPALIFETAGACLAQEFYVPT